MQQQQRQQLGNKLKTKHKPFIYALSAAAIKTSPSQNNINSCSLHGIRVRVRVRVIQEQQTNKIPAAREKFISRKAKL